MGILVGYVIPLELIPSNAVTGSYEFHFAYTYLLPNGNFVSNNNPIRPVSTSPTPHGGWEPLLAKALKDTAMQESGVELDSVFVPDLRLYKV